MNTTTKWDRHYHSGCKVSNKDVRFLKKHEEQLPLISNKPFFALRVLRQRVEKMPSVQSLVATSSLPNICGAVMAFGFMRISRWGAPQSPMAFMRMLIHTLLPAPLGPRVIIPWRTRWVSYNCSERKKGSAVSSLQSQFEIGWTQTQSAN